MTAPLRLTVLTATFNRRELLRRLFDDLRGQTCHAFEWIVVDDGSSDGTTDDVHAWAATSPFPIVLVQQPNAGKHVALNRGLRDARGDYVLIVDSDDRCPPHAVERFLQLWASIPDTERPSFATVCALCAHPDGRVVGARYPVDVMDVSSQAEHVRLRSAGERCGVSRTDVLRAFPFPEFPGERFIAEGIVWNRISARYRMRYVNEVLQTKDFQRGGLTDSIRRLRVESPAGALLVYGEMADLPLSWPTVARALINYVRFGRHAGLGPAALIRRAGRPWLCAAAMPAGLLAYVADCIALRRPS